MFSNHSESYIIFEGIEREEGYEWRIPSKRGGIRMKNTKNTKKILSFIFSITILIDVVSVQLNVNSIDITEFNLIKIEKNYYKEN